MLRIFPLFIVGFFSLLTSLHAQKQFGFDNRKPSGQPYLKPEETVQRFKVAPGWEVKLVAAEPDVVNPVAFTIDERGRIWVLECFEYPKRTPKGKKPRDRIKIIEEDPKGGPPRVTVWAEGKDLPIGWDLATGLEVGHGGVFLGAPPYLFFIKDDNGKPGKQEILLKGFGSQDTHETLNTFQWGPDSKLYGLHGVFTHSEVKPNEPGAPATGIKMNAAVWRYDVRQKKFDIFAEGTSNPWGMDFDAHGNCFLACCVIPHLFHMVPGGTYKRQAGASFNPYTYGLLNEICDHQHHKASGWAHAGLLCLDGNHVPEAYRGSVLMGSIHGCSIKRDTLRPNGSTFIASCAPDFLVSGDKNVRPINLRWGPDDSIYLIDWHDQNPCHQAAPDSWDYSRGRIYKIQRTGRTGAKSSSPPDLGKQSTKELVRHLTNDNPWWYRTTLRLLKERNDPSAIPQLVELLGSNEETHALRALWGLYAIGVFDEPLGHSLLKRPESLRSWAIRLLAESGNAKDPTLALFTNLAQTDPSPQVRLQLASTAGRLTNQDTLPLLHQLMRRKEDKKDPFIPLMLWLAYEPRITANRQDALDWLRNNGAGNPLVAEEIVPRTMRRLAATGKQEDLDACLDFLARVKDSPVRQLALEGLLLALKNRQVDPTTAWRKAFAELVKDEDGKVIELTKKLSVHFKDKEALERALALAQDGQKSLAQRIEAIRDLGLVHPPEAFAVLRDLVLKNEKAEIRVEAIRALAAYDHPELAPSLLSGWKQYSLAVRHEAVLLLSGRKSWARDLLTAVGKNEVARTDLHDNVILRIRAFGDKNLNGQIEKVWGRFRDTPAELHALIDKMRNHLHEGKGSFARGKIVFDNQCAKCHKFDGRGHDVGPNLDGAARDVEYLLANVIDPNRVVGQPYYMRIVELKNGRIETGLLVSEDEQAVTLKVENDVLKVISKKEIQGKVLVQEKSVMPEGLDKAMTPQDFRDLVSYMMAHPFLTEVHVEGGGERVQPTVGPPGRIPLPPTKKMTTIWVTAEVIAPEKMKTRLLLGCAHLLEVDLNKKRVYKDRPGLKNVAPDQAEFEVELQPGLNRLVFMVNYQGEQEALYARFWDPERKLRYPEAK